MKRFLPPRLLVVLACTALPALAMGPKKTTAPATGMAVVELFTSEGCSSCPPADEALAAVAKIYTGHVYVLAYHVDYWDRLGWKDAFSNAAWTDRQSHYATLFNLTSIYTPQAVVNGKTQFTGSDRGRLDATIDNELKLSPAAAPALEAKTGAGNSITVSCNTAALPGKLLNIALVQRNAETQVKKGENEGKHLYHVNIVRDLKTMPAAATSVSFRLPSGLAAADCLIIAFIQDKQTLAISTAAETAIH